MLHELLVTNSKQLRKHRGRITKLTKKDQQEQQMILEEEDYDPDEHFVDEQVRLATTQSGAELYADFYDRLTYEELLRAALAAVYHPQPTTGDISDTPYTPPPGPKKSPDLTTEEVQAKILARIKQGFKRLVGNFVQGVNDADYLNQVPPRYLLEIFVIISAYLRVVRRDSMLDDGTFLNLSLSLLMTLWGEPGKPGAWQALRSRLSDDELKREKTRLVFTEQAWLHAYVLAEALIESDDRRIYDLAAWMRRFSDALDLPDVLESLPDSAHKRMWRGSFPSNAKIQPASMTVDWLREISQWYDEMSLVKEIRAWPGSRVRILAGKIASEEKVPKLEVTLALSQKDIDRCLRAFALFLAWPQSKPFAWACFSNANPLENRDDLKSVRFFYRSDEKCLTFAVERASGNFHPDWNVDCITVEDLCRVHSVDELHGLESAKVIVHA